MNRVELLKRRCEESMSTLSEAAVKKLDEVSVIEDDLLISLQDAKSLWQANQLISLDEAQSLYGLLGHSAPKFNRLPLSTRMAVLIFCRQMILERTAICAAM